MPNIKHTSLSKSNIVSVPFDANFFFERGLRSLHRCDEDKALKYFQKCVDLDATNPKYITHLAASLTELGHYEQSNRYLSKVLDDLDETLTECYYYMANNYAYLGDFDQAEQYALLYQCKAPNGMYKEDTEELLDFICFELNREPKELDVEHQLLCKHEKARRCLEEGKFIEATRTLEEMVDEYPDFLAARNNLALAYYYLGQFEQALQVLEDILTRDPANLHALCNLAVFFRHKGQDREVAQLIAGLKKIYPIHVEHHYKLAITLGILGEDERAYELFMILCKHGLCDDLSIYHYVAVAAFNTKRYQQAQRFWLRLRQLDSNPDVADYYLQLVDGTATVENQSLRLPYDYQLPNELHLKKKDLFGKGTIPEKILNDPLIRSSLFWSLRHGDRETKIQVMQTLEKFLGDQEVEEVLRQIIVDPQEDEYIKKLAILLLKRMGAVLPYLAYFQGRTVRIDEEWLSKSISVDKVILSSYDELKR